MVKNILSVALLVAIAAVLINDGGRFARAKYELSNVTRDAGAACASAVHDGGDRNKAWRAGEDLAEAQGVTIYGYDQDENRVHIWTRMPVTGTWVLSRLADYTDKSPEKQGVVVDDEISLIVQ